MEVSFDVYGCPCSSLKLLYSLRCYFFLWFIFFCYVWIGNVYPGLGLHWKLWSHEAGHVWFFAGHADLILISTRSSVLPFGPPSIIVIIILPVGSSDSILKNHSTYGERFIRPRRWALWCCSFLGQSTLLGGNGAAPSGRAFVASFGTESYGLLRVVIGNTLLADRGLALLVYVCIWMWGCFGVIYLAINSAAVIGGVAAKELGCGEPPGVILVEAELAGEVHFVLFCWNTSKTLHVLFCHIKFG